MHDLEGTDSSRRIFVFFPIDQKIGLNLIQLHVTKMMQENVKRAIFVLQGPLTPFARNAIATCEKEADIKMEMFQDMDLLMNITEHALVPQHTVLTEAEKRTLLGRYRVQQTQLPRI